VSTRGQVLADSRPQLVVPMVVRGLDRLWSWATGVAASLGNERK